MQPNFETEIRAILVCVDFADMLAVTLPYNRQHFSSVIVVTTDGDKSTQQVAENNGADIHTTDVFYQDGKTFNKWAAIEEGLDLIGRDGWLCVMDADVFWPKSAQGFDKKRGWLYTPRRRIWVNPTTTIPREEEWERFPIYLPGNSIFAGYSQVFHADDPSANKMKPWYGTFWDHAGRGDTMFQQRWPSPRKARPPFEVLHLGEPGVNWRGRVSPHLGAKP